MFEIARFRVIEGHTSVAQDQGKLQNVPVSEEFELHHSRDTEHQLFLNNKIMRLPLGVDLHLHIYLSIVCEPSRERSQPHEFQVKKDYQFQLLFGSTLKMHCFAV